MQDFPAAHSMDTEWFAIDADRNIDAFYFNRKTQPIEHTKCRTWNNDKWWLDTQNHHHEKHPHE